MPLLRQEIADGGLLRTAYCMPWSYAGIAARDKGEPRVTRFAPTTGVRLYWFAKDRAGTPVQVEEEHGRGGELVSRFVVFQTR